MSIPRKPNSIKPHQNQESAAVRYAESFSGPLPSPEVLAKYDSIVPGAAKSLFDDFHKNSEHIRCIERDAINQAFAKDFRAQWMAYSLVGGMTIAGIVCAQFIAVPLGVAILVTSMPVTIGAFLKKHSSK